MDLQTLRSYDAAQRSLLSFLLVREQKYRQDVNRGLPFFQADQLNKIEKTYKEGLTFEQIDEILARRGMIVKPPTFKKYIGLKLISGTSHLERTEKANIGYYPARIIREINLVKYCLFTSSSVTDLLESAVKSLDNSNVWDLIEAKCQFESDFYPNASEPEVLPEIVQTYLNEIAKENLLSEIERQGVDEALSEYEAACHELWDKWEGVRSALKVISLPPEFFANKVQSMKQNSKAKETRS